MASENLNPKSQLGFGKWTFLKMSKIENPKYFSEKTHQLAWSYHNAHKMKKSLNNLLR
jgi:hypothetical protein